MKRSNSLTRRFALMAVALLLAVVFTNSVVAQDELPVLADATFVAEATVAKTLTPALTTARSFRVSSDWIDNIDEQFAEALHSFIADVRARTLMNIIYVATFQKDLVTLQAAVPSLVDVYRLDDVETHRLMAVQALYAIGDGYGMQRLREEAANQSSARVRAATEAALSEYEAAH